MSKYDGIAKANVVVGSVKKDKPQVKTRGYFFSLFIRIVCAGAIVALLFGGKASGMPVFQKAEDFVRRAVCYDLLGEEEELGYSEIAEYFASDGEEV